MLIRVSAEENAVTPAHCLSAALDEGQEEKLTESSEYSSEHDDEGVAVQPDGREPASSPRAVLPYRKLSVACS